MGSLGGRPRGSGPKHSKKKAENIIVDSVVKDIKELSKEPEDITKLNNCIDVLNSLILNGWKCKEELSFVVLQLLEVIELKKSDFGSDIRAAIHDAVVGNMGSVKGWIQDLGTEDPKAALTLWKDLAEFVQPKLQRSDSKIDPSSPVQLHFESIEGHEKRLAEKKSKLIENDNT